MAFENKPRVNATHVAMVFPGQGSQKAGMLSDLATNYTVIRQTFAEASDAIGFDLWQIAQSGEKLDQTMFTQPILLASSIGLWRLWQDLGGVRPQVLAGHSLGEYSALVAAGCFSLFDAVSLVYQRGKLMQEAIPAGQGCMAAILGVDNAVIEAVCQEVNEHGLTEQGFAHNINPQHYHIVDPANYNAPGQVVIAGQVDAVQQAIDRLKAKGGKVIMLPVSVPSHCRLMQPAALKFEALLEKVTFFAPEIPVIQNTNAVQHSSSTAIKANLIDQLYRPVLWTQTMQQMIDMGVQTVVECGTGNVLSNLAKRMIPPLQSYPIDTRSRLDDALAVFALAGSLV